MTGDASSVVADSTRLHELIAPEATLERVATGFGFVEGPVWHPVRECLLFSDIPGDRRHALRLDGSVVTDRWPTFMGNGMTLDAGHRLLVCEHASSSLVREHPDGMRETLAFHLDGRYLNSPNDVVVRSDGTIYFTDPWYGRRAGHGVERARVLGFQGVYRLPPGGDPGALELAVPEDLFEMPNGLCFSPDERRLYVDDTPRACIRVFVVEPDGTLRGGDVFAEGIGTGGATDGEGVVDGMRCDAKGNVWVTGPGGIWVLSPGGERLGVIRVPENAANLTWGGPAWNTLFVTAGTSVYATTTLVGPRREPYMPQSA